MNGSTRLYAIVGDPIAQARSPEVFTEQFAAHGLNAVMIPAHVPAAQLDTVIPGLMGLGNLDGLLVTLPFKAAMTRFATRLGRTAACIGALNALRREADGTWTGDMFDGAGFVQGARNKGLRLEGRRVLLFGAGGAGSAIACALAGAGVGSLRVVDPVEGKRDALIRALGETFAGFDAAAAGTGRDGFDMVVNASPVGMRPDDGLPGDVGPVGPETLIGDVVIAEHPTAMIELAAKHRCPWVGGRDMHAGQVEALLNFLRPSASTEQGAS